MKRLLGLPLVMGMVGCEGGDASPHPCLIPLRTASVWCWFRHQRVSSRWVAHQQSRADSS